jgi:hypothetical protein
MVTKPDKVLITARVHTTGGREGANGSNIRLGTIWQYLTRTMLGFVLVALGLISACSYVSMRTPKAAEDGKSAVHAAGVPSSEIEAHATTLNRLPGLVFVGSVSDLPGTAAPIGRPRDQLDVRIGFQQMHFHASVIEPNSLEQKCMFSPEAVSEFSRTLDELYRDNPTAAFPADVQMTFVPVGVKVGRTEYAWRIGKTGVFRFWFACDAARSDESLMTAFMLLTHELTHAVVSYRGAESESLRDVSQSERIADGAMACFYLHMPPQIGDQLRHSDAARVMFSDPSPRTGVSSNLDTACGDWRAKMRTLPLR